MSSGAVYGASFEAPVTSASRAQIPVNEFGLFDCYGLAKLNVECKHRLLKQFSIIDIRIFNYFSSTQDVNSHYFMSDVCRSILNKKTLITSDVNIIRDFIGPTDFFRLVRAIMQAPPLNKVIDCYTLSPVDKFTLLKNLEHVFGLSYETTASSMGTNATGTKSHYYSLNRVANDLGFEPGLTSIETILIEVAKLTVE
jgi:nucleoside-diphosphate-sugar epimerase